MNSAYARGNNNLPYKEPSSKIKGNSSE